MKAAAFGGTTTVIDFVSQDEGSLAENIDRWHQVADPKAAVDYTAHMNITRFNPGVADEIPSLVERGITSLKMFMAYKNLRLPDGDIFRVMRIARQAGMLTMLHAENGDVIDILVAEALAAGRKTPEWHARTRPAWGAVEAGLRGAALAEQANSSLYIVHMNAGGEVDQLAYARKKRAAGDGRDSAPSTCFLTRRTSNGRMEPSGSVRRPCAPRRITPACGKVWPREPSRPSPPTTAPFSTTEASLFYMKEPPWRLRGKSWGKDDFTKIPNGLPGIGDRMVMVWTYGVGTGILTPNQFVSLMCTNPAKIFGLYPRKGCLLPGADADIVLWDPKRSLKYGVQYAHHRTDYNLYEGLPLTGFPEKVFLRGNLIVDGENWLGKPGSGKFLHARPFATISVNVNFCPIPAPLCFCYRDFRSAASAAGVTVIPG